MDEAALFGTTEVQRDARQARWGAIWAGAVTIGAIAWVMSGLPQTRAPDTLVEAQRAPSPMVARAPAVSVEPIDRVQPVRLTPLAPVDVPAAQPSPVPARTAPAPRAMAPRAAAPRAVRTRQATAATEDQRIRTQVAQRLATHPGIAGRIGIDSQGAVVHLTGYTMTLEQARRAEREARNVRGVRSVRNDIRPRIGGIR